MNDVHDAAKEQVIAIDGKTMRHSFDKASKKSAIHMVSAWASESGLVFGQVKVAEKSNEITAIPELLDVLKLEGNIVTIDAMGCQVEIADKIIEKKADYVLSLKGNQGHLHEEVELAFDTTNLEEFKKHESHYFQTCDGDHGRIETREYYLMAALNKIESAKKWRSLNSVGMAISTREINGKITTERRYFITSLYANARVFGTSVRKHWGVENSLHWVLDVSFREDESRIRKDYSAENFGIVRHIALNLIKADKTSKRGVKAKRKKAGWDREDMAKIVMGNKI
jgi:predicted transposase YbfD/YdcC